MYSGLKGVMPMNPRYWDFIVMLYTTSCQSQAIPVNITKTIFFIEYQGTLSKNLMIDKYAPSDLIL